MAVVKVNYTQGAGARAALRGGVRYAATRPGEREEERPAFSRDADALGRGFDALGERYLEHLPHVKAGTERSIAENGDLVLRPYGREPERVPLLPALERPSWFDPERGGPRL